MKYLFAVIAVILIGLAVATYSKYPDMRSEVPVLYWVTDANPARDLQIEFLHQWEIKDGHCTEHQIANEADARAFVKKLWTPAMVKAVIDTQPEAEPLFAEGGPDMSKLSLPMTVKTPLFEMRVDSANRDTSKQIIQGISGVAGDVMDVQGSNMRYFAEIGLLVDVTESAKEMGYDVSKTYPATETEIAADGNQYSFPCNVYADMIWANRATFRKYDQPQPPRRWTIEEFEQRGLALCEKANAGLPRRMVFFVNDARTILLRRSMGLDEFNETLTAATSKDPRWGEALHLKYKWTYEQHLIPTSSDMASFDTREGYAGPTLQLFDRGNMAMFYMGRYALIQLRRFGQLDLAVCEPPYAEYPNTTTGSRSAGVYVMSERRHPGLAKLFQKYLASEDYNMQIVRDADALPPIPKYCEIDEFLYPKSYPNEWGENPDGTKWSVHEAFIDAINTIAIGRSYSPFIARSTYDRLLREGEDEYLNSRATLEDVSNSVYGYVDTEIKRTVKEDPKLQKRYEQAVKDQATIEKLRGEGKKVPLELITNPFYRRYYQEKGWAE